MQEVVGEEKMKKEAGEIGIKGEEHQRDGYVSVEILRA